MNNISDNNCHNEQISDGALKLKINGGTMTLVSSEQGLSLNVKKIRRWVVKFYTPTSGSILPFFFSTESKKESHPTEVTIKLWEGGRTIHFSFNFKESKDDDYINNCKKELSDIFMKYIG